MHLIWIYKKPNHNAGLYESALAQSLNNREVDLELMGNRAISAEERAGEYFKFAGAFTDVFARLDKEPHPVHRIISLPDSKESLGCRTERVFGHTQGVPTYEVVTAGPIRSPLAAIGDLALRDDLEIIVSFGGSSVELLPDNAMALKERPHERVL